MRTGLQLDNPSINKSDTFEFLRPTLQQGNSMSKETVQRLKELVS